MTGYQTYSLILCLIVFAMLTSMSVIVITLITKQRVKLINYGEEDKDILAEYKKTLTKKPNKLSKVLDFGLTLLLSFVFLVAFATSAVINCTQNTHQSNIPICRVVKTDSMAKKNPKNTYLELNGLDTQFRAMDIVVTHKLPAEEDLKLYDIVVYETDGILLIHRIVGIEEPNSKHPNERHFLLQGDAVDSPDRFPVLYSQMRGIYYGENVPFVGSFVLFLQSPAGWMCLLLVVIAVVVAPLLEKYLQKIRNLRLQFLLSAQEQEAKKSESDKPIQQAESAKPADATTVKAPVPSAKKTTSPVPDARKTVFGAYKFGVPSVSKIAVEDNSVYMYVSVKPKAQKTGAGQAKTPNNQYGSRLATTKPKENISPDSQQPKGGQV